MTQSRLYIRQLEETASLREPAMRAAISDLHLSKGSYGLDAGCGIGMVTPLLAEAIGESGRVMAVDLSSDLIDYATKKYDSTVFSERMIFRQENVTLLPFPDESFDWAWSCDCIGYPSIESLSPLTELKRVVKPGGIVAILGWTAQQFLPGYYLLEVRLNAACSGFAPPLSGAKPQMHIQRAMSWYVAAGFFEIGIKTVVETISAPLGNDIRTGLASMFEMLWLTEDSPLSAGDMDIYKRLCDPKSSDYILNLPDYYGFYVYTMVFGRA